MDDNTSLPEVFKNNHDLRELTADPLLNYLVVVSGFHKDLTGDTEINRNRIYARLLKDILERRHAKRAKTDEVALAAVEEAKDRDAFERLLETVALAAWYGDGRTTTRAEIEKLLPRDLEATWQELVTGGPGFTRLIAAFYFRQAVGAAATDAIEFTHKSSGEYLTARRLVREIADLHVELCRSGRYTQANALEDWAKLTCAQAMTKDLLRFLRDEVALRSTDEVQAWQQTLASLNNFQLRYGISLAALPSEGFREAELRARNAEESLLAGLHACACVSNSPIRPEWPHLASAGAMLNRLRNQRQWNEPSVVLACLRQFDLSGQLLYCQDLWGANLHDADLHGADLLVADVRSADLSGANLRSARLHGVNGNAVDLRKATLTGAYLTKARFDQASLREADLTQANLAEADLTQADLSGANLREADLTLADLSGANLSGAKNLTKKQIGTVRSTTGAKLPAYLKKAGPRSRTRRAGRKPTP